MALAPGSSLGAYRIIEPLGRGGMASVYKAYEAALDRHVALKVLPAEFLHEEAFAERFRREARVIARLEHPHIVPIHAFGIDAGVPWMAMRLVPGGSLADRLKGGALAPSRAVPILGGVAQALDYAHARGIVHRDVKPQNVLLDEDGRAYLADFGIARMLEGSSALTATGVVTGTPHYMAPEQALGRPVDRRADIYALGIMAYQMLVGRVPFEADTPVAVLLKQASEPLPPPPGMPDSVVRALLKGVAKSPEDRWDTAAAFVEALETGIDTGGTTALPSPPPRAPERPRGRRAFLAAAGAALALLAAAAYLGWPERSAAPGGDAANASPSAAPARTPPPETGSGVARLVVDLRHPLRTGTLRLWLDDQLLVTQRLDGRVSRDLKAFRLRKGSFSLTLEVAPGPHTVRLEVSWDDDSRSGSIDGTFRAGAGRRLDAELVRFPRILLLNWR